MAEWTTKFWTTGSMLKMKHKHFPDGLFLHLCTPNFISLYSLSLTAYYWTANFTYTPKAVLHWISGLSQSMYVQECAGFSKIHRLSQKSMCQKADMKQASCHPHAVPTNIRYHRRKFSFPHKLVHWICTPTVRTSSLKQYVRRSVFLNRTWMHVSTLKHDINTARFPNI